MFRVPPPLVSTTGKETASQQNAPSTQSLDNLFSPQLGNQPGSQVNSENNNNSGNNYMSNINQNLAPIQNQSFMTEQQYYLSNNNYSPRANFSELDSYNKRFRSNDNSMVPMGYNQTVGHNMNPNQMMEQQQNQNLVQNQLLDQNNNRLQSQQALKQNRNQQQNSIQEHNQTQLNQNVDQIQNQTRLQNQLLDQNMIPNQVIKSNPSLLSYPTPQLSNSQSQQIISHHSLSELVPNMKWNESSLTPNSSWNAAPAYSPQAWDQSSTFGSECNNINSENNFYSQPPSASGSYYPSETMSFPMMNTPIPNFVYNSNLPPLSNLDSSLMKNIMISRENQKNSNELSHVLPLVMSGPRPYSPSTSNTTSKPTMNSNKDPQEKTNPVCSTHKIRVPSHLLLTEEQKSYMEEVPVIKRVFNNEEPELSRQFLAFNKLLPEQLNQPLNKWKTRNTRKRKHAITHLYQCCCGSDVKQFHGTKGTRRSKQKFPFVGCLAFVEVARRSEDGVLIWARGLLDHSPECIKSQPFVSQ